MTKRDTDCRFCNVNEPVLANDLAFIVYDTHPVNPGHALMIPKRPVASYFETTPEEREAMLVLLFAMREKTERELSPDGYNIGVNVGDAAGQIVGHVHMALDPALPRRRGRSARPGARRHPGAPIVLSGRAGPTGSTYGDDGM